MSDLYNALAEALEACGIPFAEFEWETRPEGDFGVYQLDFESGTDEGADTKIDRSFECSVDLFIRDKTREAAKAAVVEGILTDLFEDSWSLSSRQTEIANHLIHLEWTARTGG